MRSVLPPGLTIPIDVVAIVVLVAITDALWLGLPSGLAVGRAPLGLPLVLFAPGYVVVMTLFPRGYVSVYEAALDSGTDRLEVRDQLFETRPISWTERVAFAFGTSVALVPLIGLAITPFVVSLSATPVFLSLNVFVFIGAVAGTVRRNYVPEAERYRVPYRRWARVLREVVSGSGRRLNRATFVLLLLSAIGAAGVLGFSLVAPIDGETYTATSLLTEGADGKLVASEYPAELTAGDNRPLVLRVENYEGVETTYTVVAELQRVERVGDAMRVTEGETLLRRQRTVAADGRWELRHTVAPTMVGEELRLTYHLYRGEAPRNPSSETAYRRLYLWIDVSEPNGSG